MDFQTSGLYRDLRAAKPAVTAWLMIRPYRTLAIGAAVGLIVD